MGRNGAIEMLKEARDKKSAVSLVELLVAVSLVGTIFAAGITALTTTIRFYGTEQNKHRASDDLALALNWIKKDAMRADTADTSVNNQLTLTVTDYARPGHPSNTITYSVTGTTLQRNGVAITDKIDPDPNLLPTYESNSANYPPNYLIVRMYTKDGNNTADQRMGVKMNCRERG